MQFGNFCGTFYSSHIDICLGLPKSDIGSHGVVREENILRHVADIALPGTDILACNALTVNMQRATLRLQKAQQEICRGGFSSTRAAHQCHSGACFDGKRKVFHGRGLSFGISIGDITQLQSFPEFYGIQ